MEKLIVEISKGIATYKFKDRFGKDCLVRYTIFTDVKGLKIFTNKGVVYLTPENSEVI